MIGPSKSSIRVFSSTTQKFRQLDSTSVQFKTEETTLHSRYFTAVTRRLQASTNQRAALEEFLQETSANMHIYDEASLYKSLYQVALFDQNQLLHDFVHANVIRPLLANDCKHLFTTHAHMRPSFKYLARFGKGFFIKKHDDE